MASIEERTYPTSGTVWRVCFRHNGRQQRKTFSDPERAETWRRLVEQDAPAALRLLEQEATQTPTVTEAARAHIAQLTGVTAGTKGEYESYVVHDLEPHPIGHLQVADLDRAAVSTWVSWLQGRGLAGKTIANRHGFLSAAIGSAVEAGHITANPCKGIRLPRTTHTAVEHVYLTHEEFERLLGLVAERWRPLVLLLVGTGMRFGEATALRVGDVDVATRSIRVRRAFKRTRKAAPEIGPTKTRRSTRTVSAPPQVIEAIRPLMAGRPSSALLFTSSRGSEVRQSPFWNRVWKPAVIAFAGDEWEIRNREVVVTQRGPGKHPRIHDLRHTFASWAIQNNVPLPVIQRQLGHESIQTTVDTYGHLARSDFDALATATGAMLPQLEAPKEMA